MDELELSGRRHISTKRAGKEHGYHSDYIGQLIRGQKVAGQKVGRSWYVDEESLRVYLGKEAGAVQLRTTPEAPAPVAHEVVEVPKEIIEEPVIEVPKKEEEIKIAIEEPEAVAEQEETVVEIHTPTPAIKTEEIKIPIHIPPAPKAVAPIGGLTYLPDDEPLLPTVRTRATDEEETLVTESIDDVSTPAPRRYARAMRTALVVLLAVVIVGLSATASSLVSATTTVAEGQTASVSYSFWQK